MTATPPPTNTDTFVIYCPFCQEGPDRVFLVDIEPINCYSLQDGGWVRCPKCNNKVEIPFAELRLGHWTSMKAVDIKSNCQTYASKCMLKKSITEQPPKPYVPERRRNTFHQHP